MNEGKIEIKEMDRRIDALKKSHEEEIKTSKLLHQQFAVEFFKKLAMQANEKFNFEMKCLTEQYDHTKKLYLRSEKKV